MYNSIENIKSIINYDIDVSAIDNDGRTALMYAASWSYDIAKFLCNRCPDANIKDRSGKTALMCAVLCSPNLFYGIAEVLCNC